MEALADSGASASIISWDLAKKVNMIVFEKGDATLKEASYKHMDVSGRGEIVVKEEHGIPHRSLKTLAYYLKGCTEFDLWTDHSPLVQVIKKEV